jgi:hypothetical protein
MKLVSVALLSCLAACGGTSKPATGLGNTGDAPGAASVRTIDWANRTYESGDGTFTVKDGEASFAFDENGNEVPPDFEPSDPDAFVERGYFNVAPPIYGDVTGDGVEEALIIHTYNGGGTGQFDGIDVYAMKDGQPVVIGGIPGGDRGDGGLSDATVEAGVVHVNRMMSMDGDGACCPSKLQQEVWKWNGTAFVEDEGARKLIDMPEG